MKIKIKIELSKVEIQDTPIKSILIMWWEEKTLHSVEIPIAWVFVENGFANFSDETISKNEGEIVKDIIENPHQWIQHIKDDDEWGYQIASLDCEAEELPEKFAV